VYRASDAAAKNADVRKSREMKKALLADAAKGGPAKSTGSRAGGSNSGAGTGGDAKPTKHRKGPSKSGSRKPKAKS
jgi:ribonuclease R